MLTEKLPQPSPFQMQDDARHCLPARKEVITRTPELSGLTRSTLVLCKIVTDSIAR